MKHVVALLLFFVMLVHSAIAQHSYVEAKPGKLEGVIISYKLVPVHFYNPKGAKCIVMRFENNTENERHIEVEGEINQPSGLLQAEEFKGSISVPANKTRRGKLNGLVFHPELLNQANDKEVEIEFIFKERL